MSYPFQKDAITLTDLLKMMKQIELNFIGEVDMKELRKNDKLLRKYTDAERAELKRVSDENSTPDEVDCGTLMYMNKKEKYKYISDIIKDLQGARDTISYIAEQQDQFWSEESWDVLIGVKEDIEYLTRELSMVKINDIAKDLKENGYEKI